ncbi:SRPBCC family protein [uncultured Pseudoteredinibacter sp.]|uniref:aromatic ring-hydroxylating oxygenase subunit alpha n=1 Tax=uncultured Pseudoteredinibacter sp. TaxID=1641701 RepID=UPI002633BFB7|nr:SRPBCC family protein [uncultured Pseudoteredinibacter sp.]
MQRQAEIDLIKEILTYEENKSTDMQSECSSINVDCYTREDQFSKEEQLFKDMPIIVGHSSQLQEAGDYFTREICKVPLIVLRQKDGSLKAFINVCKHRGGRLTREASGKGLRSLVCQYHAWTYETNGNLRGIPHRDGFSNMPDGCKSLTELPLTERFGFIWLRLSPITAEDKDDGFEAELDKLLGDSIIQDLEDYQLDSHVVFDPKDFHRPINWKLAVDTFMENYHVKKTHKETIDFMFLDTVGSYKKFGLQQRNLYPKKTITNLRDKDESEWHVREHGNFLYLLFPNTLLLVEPDHINVSIVYPDGIGHTQLINFTLLPEAPNEKGIAYFRKNNEILYRALEEDFSMASDVQQGLYSGACQEFLHGRFEQGLRYFHDNIEQVLKAQ